MVVIDRGDGSTNARDREVTDTTREVREPVNEREPKTNVAARVVWYIAGILLSLLGLRFLFKLLGANPNNGLADFLYSVTYPFVAPFFNLFQYDVADTGVGRFEGYTLVAMLIYALIAWAIARALTLKRH